MDEFDAIPWHDSKLRGVNLTLDPTNSFHVVLLDLEILVDTRPGHYRWRKATGRLSKCERIEMQFDLVFKLECSHDIFGATSKELASESAYQARSLRLYSFNLIPPNGPLTIVAAQFDLQFQ